MEQPKSESTRDAQSETVTSENKKSSIELAFEELFEWTVKLARMAIRPSKILLLCWIIRGGLLLFTSIEAEEITTVLKYATLAVVALYVPAAILIVVGLIVYGLKETVWAYLKWTFID